MASRIPTWTIDSSDTNGELCYIRIRVSCQGDREDLYTGIIVPKSKWDNKRQRVKQGCKVRNIEYFVFNDNLDEMEDWLAKYVNDLYLRKSQISLSELKSQFNAKFKAPIGSQSEEFFYLLNQYIEQTEVSHSWGKEYRMEWRRVAESLKEYKPNLRFTDLTHAVLTGYLVFLSSTMYNDKINKNLQKLREFVKWAKSKRYPVHEDFFAFYPKLKETVKDVVKGKVDFPQIGFEKGTTERGFQR